MKPYTYEKHKNGTASVYKFGEWICTFKTVQLASYFCQLANHLEWR